MSHEPVGDEDRGFTCKRVRHGVRGTHQGYDRGGNLRRVQDGVTYRLNKLVEHGAAVDDRGKSIANVADARLQRANGGRRCTRNR